MTHAERLSPAGLPGFSRFYRDLVARAEVRRSFLGVDDWNPGALRDAAAEPRAFRGLAELIRQNPAVHPAVAESLAQARASGAVTVVTGQQAGALGGPPYTLYKALTVAALVAELRRQGVPAVGIFWVASEDHDLREVADFTWMVPGRGLQRLTLPTPGAVDLQPVADVALDGTVETFVQGALELLPSGSTHRDWITGLVAECYRPDRRLAEAFRDFMGRLLAPLGLLLFDPMAMDRAGALAGFLAAFPERRAEAVRRVTAGQAALEAAGYEPQIRIQPGRAFLFYLHPDAGRRRVVEAPGGGFAVDGTSVACGADGWPDWLGRDAARFSPDALLRPLFQDWLFPTVAYVGGPAELAYHAEIRSLYPLWELTPPLVWPRFSATLVTPGASRRARQLGVQPTDLFAPREDLLAGLLAARGRVEKLEAFQARRGEVAEALDRLVGSLLDHPEDVTRLATSTLGKVQGLLDKLEERVRRQVKTENEDLIRRFDLLHQELLPDGHLQERTLNLVPLLGAYGPALVDRLMRAVEPFDPRHVLLDLEE
jgi:bacillithiol biosynthesis cysteine-adding enzyme BshC